MDPIHPRNIFEAVRARSDNFTPLPSQPTTAPPGPSKVEILTARLQAGVELWNDADDHTVPLPDD